MKFGIILLVLIMAISFFGTVIEQGKPEEFYLATYGAGHLILALGLDNLYYTPYFLGLGVLLILNLFIRDRILYWLALALLSYCYFRMFSKNISARLRENAVYLRWRSQVTEKLKKWKAQAVQAWKYHIYRCPGCGQKIRIPRGRGKVSIHCPKCHTDFIRRS